MRVKKAYLEVIRVMAIILVIFHHLDITSLYYHNTNNIITYLFSVLDTLLVKIDVPLFFMISGAVLLEKEEPVKDIWKKRIPRILFVLLLFSALQYLFRYSCGFISSISIGDFGARFFKNEIQPTYWFLYAYLGFLVVLPILRAFVRGMGIKEMLILLGIAAFIDLMAIMRHYINGFEITDYFLDVFRPFVTYPIYWLTGYIIDRDYDLIKNNKFIVYLSSLILVAWLFVPTVYSTIRFWFDGQVDDYLVESSYFVAPVVAFFLMRVMYDRVKNRRFEKISLFLGEYCFGIYLLESLVRSGAKPIYIWLSDNMYGILASLLFAILTLTVSLIGAFALKRIPYIKEIL